MSIEEQLTESEAKAVMLGGLGKYELLFVTSLATPLFWAYRTGADMILTRNGTAFFLDAGQGVFGVTAAHVIDGWRKSKILDDAGPLRLGGDGQSLKIDWDERVIDAHEKIDIATFRVTAAEVRSLGKTVLTGWQKEWPPGPPRVRCGVTYSGYPGDGTRHPSTGEVVFGAAPGSGIATSVSERDISFQLEREHLYPMLGNGLPPENFDFGGLSGGPMLTIVQNKLRSWALAGVLYQGPNTSSDPNEAISGLEIIKARRAHFLRADGTLDVDRWEWS